MGWGALEQRSTTLLAKTALPYQNCISYTEPPCLLQISLKQHPLTETRLNDLDMEIIVIFTTLQNTSQALQSFRNCVTVSQ